MIEINGLSRQQRDIADRIWACETQEEVDQYIGRMPRRLRRQALLIRELMIAAALDQYEGDLDLAKEVIEMVK